MKKAADLALVIGVVLLGILLALSIYIDPTQDPYSPDVILQDAPYDLKQMNNAQAIAFIRKHNVGVFPHWGWSVAYNGVAELFRNAVLCVEAAPNEVMTEENKYIYLEFHANLRRAILKHYGIKDEHEGEPCYDTSRKEWWELP